MIENNMYIIFFKFFHLHLFNHLLTKIVLVFPKIIAFIIKVRMMWDLKKL